MKIVTVIPLKKDAARTPLSYFTAKEISVGNVVEIPLRNKKTLGIVTSVVDATDSKGDIKDLEFNLKKVSEIKGNSIWRSEYLEAIIETSKYNATSENNIFSTLIPAIFRDNYDQIEKFSVVETNAKDFISVQKSIKAEKLIFQEKEDDRISQYKTLIRESFALKKSVFIVLPTERDVKSLYESLSRGIEQFAFFIHSGLSHKKVLEKIEQIMTLNHGVLIIGTTPFLSIPRHDIGVVILERESSSAYRTISRPHFDLRVFVELFASKINARLIISDTILRFETIGRKEIDHISSMHPLSYRTNFDGVIEVKHPEKNLHFKIFPEESIAEIHNTIVKKKNVFIFSLRKGLATMTICKDCTQVVSCEKCGSPVVLYYSEAGKKRMFVCNRCQSEKSPETVCVYCGSWNLLPIGIGTDTVLDELIKYFPKKHILKLDKESAKNKSGAIKIIKEFESNPGSILIGTEMALFYLNKEIPLSLIASFDSLWSIPNYKMSEKIIQLLISILRNTSEKFIIQTKNEEDPAIIAFRDGNLLSFIREELSDRKKLHYPPYKRFIKITHMGSKQEAIISRKILSDAFKNYEPEIFSGFVSKIKGKYATNALIKIDPKKWSLPEITTNGKIDQELLSKLRSLPPNFEILVDPEDLL